MFEPLLEELNNNIIHQGGKEEYVPAHLKECISLKGTSHIRSWLWKVPKFRRWRVTSLKAGNKLEVLNSVAYPSYEIDLPIMGIDLLWFGQKQKLVAVLDFQPLIQDQDYLDKYFGGLQRLRDKFSDFNDNNNMKVYDPNQYFSPWVLFCRGDFQKANELLPNVFSSFLNAYLETFKIVLSVKPEMDASQVKKLHIEYDKYSAERDPAHSLFAGFFGKKWSDDFLKQFLFPLSTTDAI